MAGCGRFMLSNVYGNFLYTRNYLLSFAQNVSRSALKCAKEDIFALKPKKPETAFLLYTKSVRPKLIEENPDLKPFEIIKKASKEWAKLDPTQKEDFKKMYHQKYELYVQQLKDYENSLTEEQRQLLKERKKRYQDSSTEMDLRRKSETFGKPKKPPNGFLLYMCSKKNEKGPNIMIKDWIRELTINWKKLPDTEKEQYMNHAEEMMTQYRRNLEEWEKNMIDLGHPEIVRHNFLRYRCRICKHCNVVSSKTVCLTELYGLSVLEQDSCMFVNSIDGLCMTKQSQPSLILIRNISLIRSVCNSSTKCNFATAALKFLV